MIAISETEPSNKMETTLHSEPFKSTANVDAVFIPTTGSEEELAHAAYLASLADPSRHGKLIASAAIRKIGPVKLPRQCDLIAASPTSNLSGVNLADSKIREGTLESVEKWIKKFGGHIHNQVHNTVKQIASRGDHPIVIASEKIVLGIVILKVMKPI